MKRTNRRIESHAPGNSVAGAGNPWAGAQILLMLMLAAGAHGSAAASPALPAAQTENWLQAQIRQFRSYPHLHRAYRLMDQNKLAEAAEEMKAYLDIDPRDRNVRMSYLNVLYRLKNMGELLRQTEQVLAQDPDNVTALLYHALANQVKGNVGATLSSFRRVYQNRNASKEYRIFAANTAADIGMSKSLYLESLAALTTLASFQDSYFVHYQRGAALDALGNAVESERAYQMALERATKSQEKIQALSALGYLAQKGENYGKAKLQGEAILVLEPQNIEWLRTLAEIYYREKNYEHAEHLARRSLDISKAPGDRIYLANVLSERRNYAAAIELYRKVVQDAMDDPTLSVPAHRGLGYAYQATGRQQAARAAFARAAYLTPGSEVKAAPAPDGVASASKSAATATSLADFLAEYKMHPDAHGAASIGYLYGEKGDHASAAAYFELALQASDFPEWRLCLAEQYAELANRQKAVRVLAKFTPRNALDWRRISEVHSKTGDPELAIAAQEKGADTADAQLQLSQRYLEMQRPDKALAALQAVMRLSTAVKMHILALRQTGYIQSQAGNDQGALEAFQLALANGDTGPETGKELGFLYAKLQKYPEAVVQFLRVLDSERNARNMLAVARAYVAMGQGENALRYYKMAQADIQDLDQDEQPAVYAEMGFLYAQENDFPQAKSFWLKSAEARDTPQMQINLAYADEMQGMPQAALLRLERVRNETLDKEQQLALFEKLAGILEKTGNVEKSAYYMQQAIDLEPSAELHYQFALLSMRQKKNELARAHLEEAVSLAPQNNNYRQQLAYFCKEQGDTACAVKWFEQLLAQPGQSSSLYQDLAYTYAQAGETGKAVASFKSAIDSKSVAASGINSEADAGSKADSDAEQVYAMRQQVREMARRYQLNVSQSYRASRYQSTSNITPGVISGGLVPSQGGIEFLYQPPEIGYQNGRILRVFGRDLWSNRPQSLSIDSRTYQGGIGIEYKPIGDLNAYVSVEKLVKIGSQSENNWLARASWGYSDGYDIKLNESSWRQTIMYADIGYFLQGSKIRSIYAELRHGQVFNFENATMVTPHLTLAGRSQRPDPYNSAYLEGGAGVALKHLFNQTPYAAARSSAELLVQYRKSVTGQHTGGWVLTAVLQF